MDKPFSLFDTAFLEKAMDAASLRGRVISNNIANINNPEHQAQDVEFEGQLREAMAADAAGYRRAAADLKPSVVAAAGPADINTEMANLAKNQILYNAYANRVSQYFSQLKWIIENSGR